MSQLFLRAVTRTAASSIQKRAFSASPACSKAVVLDQKLREEIHPKIGSREIVGYGQNGQALYWDHPGFPCPAIRFKEATPEVLELQKKEAGDWKNLSLEEKKTLYRHSFCQTYVEMEAPTGEYKEIVALVLYAIAATGVLLWFMKDFVYGPLPYSFTPEHQRMMLKRQIDEGQGHLFGIASKWDYEKMRWKE